jgi:hypothetical protein
MINTYKILVGNPEGSRSLGRPRSRWVDNIKACVRDVGIGGYELDSSGSE